MIVYDGPSMLNGAPIVAIVTGKTRNRKTGAMPQVWILPRETAPHTAVKSGDDESVCGDCKHRGTSCYVLVHNAPLSVWRAFHRGTYGSAAASTQEIRHRLMGLPVRMSAYGDAAALPLEVVEACLDGAHGHTGYTHQWRHAFHLAPWLMASVDSPAEAIAARMLGWRTFRVRHKGAPLQAREIECLAESAGITCAQCGLCSGNARPGKRHISIEVHGNGKSKFNVAMM